MKRLRIICSLVILSLFANCNFLPATNTAAPKPDFTIGKSGFEKTFKEVFEFEAMTFGTIVAQKNGVSNTGLNLTFKMKQLDVLTEERIYKYADIIQFQTKKYLLDLNTYNYVNITFKKEHQIKDILKVSFIEIRRKLN